MSDYKLYMVPKYDPSKDSFMEPKAMTPDLIMGLDPGKCGGISLLDFKGAVVGSYPIPETEHEAVELIGEFAPRIAFCAIERLQPMFKASKVAMFKLGRSYGFLRGILTVMQIPFDEVPPKAWQATVGCVFQKAENGKAKNNKAVTRAKAQQLFTGKCPVRITDKIADSLLIAEHARRTRC